MPSDSDLANAVSQRIGASSANFDDVSVGNAIRDFGARFDPEVLQGTRALYRAPVADLPWADRPVVSDIAYGPAERNRLDFFAADDRDAPIIVFLHGGGFVGGHKSGDPLFYSNVGRYFAAHGFHAVLANYRLAPEATWPSGIEDVEGTLTWIDQHAPEFGADCKRVVFVGQSAGAAHVAGYLFSQNSRAVSTTICGAALMSGFFRAKRGMSAGPGAYFGKDQADWPRRSPAMHVSKAHPPILLTVAEFDPAEIAEQTLDLACVLNEIDGHPPQLIWFEGQNHVSTVHGLGLGNDEVGTALLRFARRVTA